MPAPLRFVFDFVSPYAYVGWKHVVPLAARAGRELELEPVLFAALLDAHGTKGPAEVPAKRAYVIKDVYRKAHAAGLALVPPPAHPFNSLLALRAAGLDDLDEDARRRLVDALFDATWAGGGGIDSAEKVARVATDAGLDGAAIVHRAGEPQAKERLRSATDEAAMAGIFGVPTLVADGEVFWGVDSLEHAERFLAGADPLPPDLLARWADLPVGAKRRSI
jgi:2-hydroxychromene-2-carboxylate isomerase